MKKDGRLIFILIDDDEQKSASSEQNTPYHTWMMVESDEFEMGGKSGIYTSQLSCCSWKETQKGDLSRCQRDESTLDNGVREGE